LQIGDQWRAELLANGLAPLGALTVGRPLDLEHASIRCTASSAGGEITVSFLALGLTTRSFCQETRIAEKSTLGPSVSILAGLASSCTGFIAAGGSLVRGTSAACQIARGVDQCEM
jgi:hypothetical protein